MGNHRLEFLSQLLSLVLLHFTLVDIISGQALIRTVNTRQTTLEMFGIRSHSLTSWNHGVFTAIVHTHVFGTETATTAEGERIFVKKQWKVVKDKSCESVTTIRNNNVKLRKNYLKRPPIIRHRILDHQNFITRVVKFMSYMS